MNIANKKGITPIISVILLLMMTIAIAGLAYTWLQRMQTTVQTGTENTSEELLGTFKVRLRIDGFNTTCSGDGGVLMTVSVKNTGTEAANNIQLYVDDALEAGGSASAIAVGQTMALNSSYNRSCTNWINRTHTLKVACDETTNERDYTITCTSTQQC